MIRARLITIGVSANLIAISLFASSCKLPERSTALNRQPGVASSPNPTCSPVGSPACEATPTPTIIQGPPPVLGAPALHFSDIISGPKTGLGDGLGSGAIVTVWGGGLGSSQGSSKIYIGGVEATHVYYWGNADTSGASGPADLYSYHKMQTISFSVPPTAADGANAISVTVNGAQSNTLPFTVRPGKIYYVKVTGSDSGNGSWSNPWRSLAYVGSGAGGVVVAGDTIYIGDGVKEIGGSAGFAVRYIKATEANPISVIAYPGAYVMAQGGHAISNWNHGSSYWNFSKFVTKTSSVGIDTFKGGRIVGNEVTNAPGECATGAGGAISGNNYGDPYNPDQDQIGGGVKVYGNFIHDFGCDSTSKLHHVFYISQRGGYPVESYELGWNYLVDNKAIHALHVYDESRCGDFTGVMKIHDNVVKNQVGVGVDVSTGGATPACFTMPVWIYNNLFINVGIDSVSAPGHSNAVGLSGSNNLSVVKFYNNTFYGFGDLTDSGATFWHGKESTFGGTLEWVNNIVFNTKGIPYQVAGAFKIPAVHSNNLWYDLTGMQATPSWDQGASPDDPLFTDVTMGLFTLKPGSPALGQGINTSPMVIRDILGIPRGISGSYSIGALE